MSRTALVVGATRGLGLACARRYRAEGWQVIATTIEPSAALDELACDALEIRSLDITDVAGVAALKETLSDRTLDVVHIVAGVFQASDAPIWEQPDDEILRLLHTNAIGGIRLAETVFPLVPAGGAFAFTSSGMGSLARNMSGGVDLYRISKAALNMLVRSFAARHAGEGRAVLLFCPGWAKTDMGGPEATVEVADSVAGMYAWIDGACEESDGPVFREYTGEVVPW